MLIVKTFLLFVLTALAEIVAVICPIYGSRKAVWTKQFYVVSSALV